MLAGDIALGLEPLEILADRRFGDREGRGKVAHARAALFLQPFEDLHAPRLGQQLRRDRLGRRAPLANGLGRPAFCIVTLDVAGTFRPLPSQSCLSLAATGLQTHSARQHTARSNSDRKKNA